MKLLREHPDLISEASQLQLLLELEAEICDRCGHVLVDIHCRLRCFNCGYERDCSDP